MVTVVDYGVGNLASIRNMLKKAGSEVLVTGEERDILSAEKIILPGVGAFDTCMDKLQQSGLIPSLNKKVLQEKTPVLGICVGMQMLTQGSEEGVASGLGWIPGRVIKFNASQWPSNLKIPHMGWTDVLAAKPSRLFEDMFPDPRFYFVHSYYAVPEREDDVWLYSEYGQKFAAAMQHENIFGVQFHPEKSHKFGLKLLENFVNILQ